MISVKNLLSGKRLNKVFSLPPESMVIEALELMEAENIGAIIILDGERLAGIFSERDYTRKGIIKGRKAKSTPVTDVMTATVFTVSPEMDIEDCMKLFTDKRIRHLPVVANEKVIGVIWLMR